MAQHPYLRAAGLDVDVPASLIADARRVLTAVLESQPLRLPTAAQREALFRYKVPKLSADGVCSLHDELAAEPYDLGASLGRRDDRVTRALTSLNLLVDAVATHSKTDWVGVYQKRRLASGPALVKLAYCGVPSRAEFPLTEAFAAKSNNSAVGLTGRGRLLNDINAHVRGGGPYYECDPQVESETCLPLFDTDAQVAGIIDAESFRSGHFTPERLAWFVALALEAAFHLPR